jgi:ribosomal-protein-alanine N-acetyltransferase
MSRMTSGPATPTDRRPTPTVRFLSLSVPVLQALVAGDRALASTLLGVQLSDFFVHESGWLWRVRLPQVLDDPESAAWIARAAVNDAGDVVGFAGFHGPPDGAGMVEVGYSVEPAFRRQGYARAMLAALLQRARDEPGVFTFRATIAPDNIASLATIAGFGFREVGEQDDPEDGLEIIYEVPLA